jgi:hypothetical protein
MEKFIFSKIETWIVLLLAILAVVGAILFAALALDKAREKHRTGALGTAALAIAEMPQTVIDWTKQKDARLAGRTEEFKGKAGWWLSPTLKTAPIDGYLLLSRAKIEADQNVVELLDLSDFTVKHTWMPNADEFFAGVRRDFQITKTDRWNRALFEPVHPLMFANGDLIVKDHQSPIARIDACSRMIWRNTERNYHHSLELAPDGTLWVPSVIDPPDADYGPKFFEDGLVNMTVDGKTLSEVSLAKVMEANGMMAMAFTSGAYINDAIHLNDIQPVPGDGPYWKAGDLFLSARHLSMVMLYRPSTQKIVWWKIGPWLAQHDVNVLDDHRIAVFDNNAYDRGKGWYIDGVNEVMVYDFATDQITTPYHETMKAENVLSVTEGLVDFTDNGHVIIEEENRGRILILDPAGQKVAEFVNRGPDGQVYGLSWSRWIPRSLGDAGLKSIAAAACPG